MLDGNNDISIPTLGNFETTEFSLSMLDFPIIYNKLSKIIPPRNLSFLTLNMELSVACEVVCAAICHQINWDFLRGVILERTINMPEWISPKNLRQISSQSVWELLKEYNKPERIRADERAKILRDLGNFLYTSNMGYLDIFIDKHGMICSSDFILEKLNNMVAFSGNLENKKIQLLLQNLSDFSGLAILEEYCKPAIDYHIIRLYLRRGMIKPQNQEAIEYIFSPEKQRQEKTVAAIRKLCSEVFELIRWLTQIDIKTINSIEWWVGRSICRKDNADCHLTSQETKWIKKCFDKCPFCESCYAYKVDDRYLRLIEPTYIGTSY